jgi:hypothetical protein
LLFSEALAQISVWDEPLLIARQTLLNGVGKVRLSLTATAQFGLAKYP